MAAEEKDQAMKDRPFQPFLAGAGVLRSRITAARIRRESARTWPGFPASTIGQTDKLEILPLYEAEAGRDFLGGSGVSYLIRTDHATILFDLGNNPQATSPSPLLQNMARLGLSLRDIDLLFISHRHPDHVGGWKWWKDRTFSPDGASQPALGALPVYVSDRLSYPGSRPRLTAAPVRLAEGVMTTGSFTFFEPYPSWHILPDYSEQALAVNVAGLGMVLITGCGHMGLKTLLERARSVFGLPVAGIVGGLHYTDADALALQPEIQYLRKANPGLLALSAHDSGPEAIAAFAQAFPASCRTLRVGEAIGICNPGSGLQPANQPSLPRDQGTDTATASM